jgi:DNA-binding NarL/FixJ family response regulator
MDAVSAAPPVASFRVLIADAGIPVNERIVNLLSDVEGLTVFGCAQEPSKVIDLVRSVQPDVAILDLTSLGSAGIQTLETLKALPHPPVAIVLSDYDEATLRRAWVAAGADHFIAKATGWNDLLRVLRELRDRVRA